MPVKPKGNPSHETLRLKKKRSYLVPDIVSFFQPRWLRDTDFGVVGNTIILPLKTTGAAKSKGNPSHEVLGLEKEKSYQVLRFFYFL